MKVASLTCHACVTLCLFVHSEQNIQYKFKIFSQSVRGCNSALGLQISFHSANRSAHGKGWRADKWEALQFSVTIPAPEHRDLLRGTSMFLEIANLKRYSSISLTESKSAIHYSLEPSEPRLKIHFIAHRGRGTLCAAQKVW